MLVSAIIIAGNNTGTNIAARTDLTVANVRQVISLGAVSKMRVLYFNKVANSCPVTEMSTGSQTCERTDVAS